MDRSTREGSLRRTEPQLCLFVRIAYIDHSYHIQTASTMFLLDLLREIAEVDVYFDESWLGNENVDLSEILARHYDVIVLFQVERHAKVLNDSSARVIFVPMYDSCLPFADDFWKGLTCLEILCFCRALYERLAGWGLRTRYVQFFPEVVRFDVNTTPERAGFFWSRLPEPSWQTVKALLGQSRLSWINIHQARDPLGAGPLVLADGDEEQYQLRFTEWADDKTEYTRALHQAGIFFAPRLQEGIGMAFLESMAMGKAVVAADNPTMNEYITDQVNGYLFDPNNPKPLDLHRFREIGRTARESMERGRRRWEQSERAIKQWIITGDWPERETACLRRWNSPATVSVIVLSARDQKAVEQTRSSVENQSHAPLEQIVAHAHRGIRSADLLNRTAATAKGEWLIFLSAGTVFQDENALGEALDNASVDTDFITCHYLEQVNGREFARRVAWFDSAVERLATGQLDSAWFASLPILSATLIKRRLFERTRFAPRFRLAADIDFFLRARRIGAIFRHGNTTLAHVRGADVDDALRRIKECRRIFLREASSRASIDALCSSLNQKICDPLLDVWRRLGALHLAFNLICHRSVACYARDRALQRFRYLGIPGILLRQLLWLRARREQRGDPPALTTSGPSDEISHDAKASDRAAPHHL